MKALKNSTLNSLKRLSKLSPAIQSLIGWLAARNKATWETKVRVASERTGLASNLVLQAFRQFEELGFGKVIEGRRGYETRFEWFVSSVNLARKVSA